MTNTPNYRENAKPQDAVYISALISLVSGRRITVTRKCYYTSFEGARDSSIRVMRTILCSKEPYDAGNMFINIANITHVECEILTPETPGSDKLILHKEFMSKWREERSERCV